MNLSVYARYLRWPAGVRGTPEDVKRYQAVRVLHYSYSVDGPMVGMCFHLLCEVGEPWQAAAKAKLDALLAANPSFELKQVELPAHPWYVDALVRK